MWPFKKKKEPKPKPDIRLERTKCGYPECKYFKPEAYYTYTGWIISKVCIMCTRLNVQKYDNYVIHDGDYRTDTKQGEQ